MRFGFMLLPRGLGETREVARSGEASGFEWMGIADSPTVYQESYLHQLEAARQTERIRIGPVASHVVARHPVIVANLLATLNEFSDGRGMAALATGNSAARGLGLKPATVAELRQGVEAIRAYWRGEGAEYSSVTYPNSSIPATGLARDPGRLLVAADGPKATSLAGEIGDGLLYGGTLEPDTVRRRFEAGRRRQGQEVWVGPSVSVRDTLEEVRDELGAMIIAMANRAFRGDLDERNVPADIQADVRQMWERYDYAFHADSKRPQNVEIVTPALSEYLIEHFCIWGSAERWRERLDWLSGLDCDGVMFILGQSDQAEAVREIGARLAELGLTETMASR
jgi:alkanesulfonate monooxygenase SsuD/methylene tetrahydromethanopterin reductase-like flavin-dependent oxidoreductase (luciferase family)